MAKGVVWESMAEEEMTSSWRCGKPAAWKHRLMLLMAWVMEMVEALLLSLNPILLSAALSDTHTLSLWSCMRSSTFLLPALSGGITTSSRGRPLPSSLNLNSNSPPSDKITLKHRKRTRTQRPHRNPRDRNPRQHPHLINIASSRHRHVHRKGFRHRQKS